MTRDVGTYRNCRFPFRMSNSHFKCPPDVHSWKKLLCSRRGGADGCAAAAAEREIARIEKTTIIVQKKTIDL